MSKKRRNKYMIQGYVIELPNRLKGTSTKMLYHVPFDMGDPRSETFYRYYKVNGYVRIPETIENLQALENILGSRIEALKALADKYRGVKHPFNMK